MQVIESIHASRTHRRDPSPAGTRSVAVTLAAITALALLIRLPSWGNSLFGDEVGTFFVVSRHSLGGVVRLLYGHSVDLTPPLLYVLDWLVERLGQSPQLLRLVPLLAGLATVPLTYAVGRRTIGAGAAWLGSLLLAISPFASFYSTEARAYALVMALCACSTVAMLRALEGERRLWWALYTLTSAAALYTHYTAGFVLGVQAVWALISHPRVRAAVLLANGAAALLFAPWLPALIENSHSFGTKVFGILEPFGASAVFRDLGHWSVGHPFLTLATVPGVLAGVAIAAGMLWAFSATAVGMVRPQGHGQRTSGGLVERLRHPAVLPLLLAAALPVGLAVYSSVGTSVWDLRNLAASTPGLALTAGALLSAGPKLGRIGATALVVTGLAAADIELLSPSHQRPDYLAAATFILRSGGSADPVAVVPAPTPGPLSGVDAAFANAGDPGRTLLRIGSAPLSAVLRAPPYALVPATPPAELARQATNAPGRTLFVVAPGTAALSALLSGRTVNAQAALGSFFASGASGRLFASVFVPLSGFLRALRPHFRPVQTRTFPGFLRVSVYVFQRDS